MHDRLLKASAVSLASAAAIVACVGSDPDPVVSNRDASLAPGPDPLARGADAADTGQPDVPCARATPFNAPSTATLMALNVATADIPMRAQYSPRLSADEKTIYYVQYPGVVGTDIAPAADVFTATRSSREDAFPTGIALKSIDTKDLEEDPFVTSDGLSIFYTTDHLNGTRCASATGRCIAQASRPSETAGFSDAGLVANNLGDQRFPYAAGTLPTLYYAANSSTTKSWDITSNAGSDAFVNVNGLGVETSPVVTPDELVLYFASDRDSDGGGQLDIYVATRENKNDPFGAPVRVDALSTDSDEYPGYASGDGCRLYFTRDDEGAGGLNLYFTSKTK